MTKVRQSFMTNMRKIVKDTQTACKTVPFTMQNGTFYNAIGYLLERKKYPIDNRLIIKQLEKLFVTVIFLHVLSLQECLSRQFHTSFPLHEYDIHSVTNATAPGFQPSQGLIEAEK